MDYLYTPVHTDPRKKKCEKELILSDGWISQNQDGSDFETELVLLPFVPTHPC